MTTSLLSFGPELVTILAIGGVAVILFRAARRRSVRSGRRWDAEIREVTVHVNAHAALKGDRHPVSVDVLVEVLPGAGPEPSRGRRVRFPRINADRLENSFVNRIIEPVTVLGRPTLRIADPAERESALRAAQGPGYVFRLDPPFPVYYWESESGGFDWAPR